MKAKRQVQRQLKQDYRRYKRRIAGILGDYSGTVDVLNRVGYVFVRLRNQEVKEAFNKRVPSLVDLPVWVGYSDDPGEPQILQVLDTRTGVERQKGEDPIGLFIPAHHETHEWFNPLGGQDVVFSDKRQFMPFRPTPIGGMLLHVYRNVGWLNGEYTFFSGSSIDLSPYVPATGAYFGLVYEDTNATLSFSSGTGDFLKNAFTLTLADIPNPIPGTYPIAAVRMWGGMTGIVEALDRTDLIDLRFPFTQNFLLLSDVPWSYTGSASQLVSVKSDETGLEFISSAGITGSSPSTFLGLTDTPSSYSGQADKLVVVNTNENALEFRDNTGTSGGGGYDTVQDEGSGLTQQNTINFVGGGVEAVNDPANSRTTIRIPGTVSVFDDGIFQVSGTALDFMENLDVAVTGTHVFISSSSGTPDAPNAAPGGTLNLLTTPVTIISIGNHNGFPNIARLSNGNLMVVYRDAADHSASKGIIKYQTSSDNGDTWSAQSTIFSDATYDCRDPGIVVLDSGRIVVSFFKWDHTASPETWANSGLADAVHTTYSDDSGSSWSTPVALNSSFQKTASPGSPILLPDGTLRLAQYGVKDPGDTFRSASIFTSSDNGESWGTEIVIADGEADSRLYEEPCITYLHTGEILCLIRSDTTSQFFRTISQDTGLTWADPTAVFSATGKPFNMQLKNGMVITIYRATADAQADYRISRDNGYSWEDALELHTTSAIRMAYAGAVEYDEGILGVVVSDEDTSSDANLFFYRFYTTVEGGQLVSNVPDGTAPIVVESQTLVTNLNADMVDGFHASELVYDYILIRDEKTAGTEGGTFTSGAWRTRVLNTEAADTGSRASISSNQITLAAGTYRVRIRCPGFMVVNHKAKLQNITDGTVILIGSSEYSTSASATAMNYSEIVGRFTIAAPKVIEVQHRCTTTRADNGFGVAANIDSLVEVYTIVEMWREPS